MKKILIIYDRSHNHNFSTFIFLNSFKKFSKNKIYYMHCNYTKEINFDLDLFDCVILFYSLRLPSLKYTKSFYKKITHFNGEKILFSQDEQDFANNLNLLIKKLKIDQVFTPVSKDKIRLIFKKQSHLVKYHSILTSYIDDDFTLKNITQTHNRSIIISYRGRNEPLRYGSLGLDKALIGVNVRKFCKKNKIKSDIEIKNYKRIYWLKWYKFLSKSVAVLCSETGCNLIDWNNDLSKKIDNIRNKSKN